MLTQVPFTGDDIYRLAQELFPVHRSITGNGVRRTHDIIRKIVPELTTHEIPTGTKCFDWTMPDEWNVEEAYIEDLSGNRVVDFAENNLHLVGYSTPVDEVVTRDELMAHLYSIESNPDAIPFVTSYFDRQWGFCMSDRQRQQMNDDKYRVVIRSTLEPGFLTYGEILIPGDTDEEILIHTYTCHPAMGNNETSGMCVTTFLARAIIDMPHRRYSYRIVLTPETIGAVAYISRNLDALRQNIAAGFVITCVGDDRVFSLLPSKRTGSLPERAARHALGKILGVQFDEYSFIQRGSDERQYCAPGVDLDVISIMRSKYDTYPEYHTSKDDLTVLSPEGLWGGFQGTWQAINVLETNEKLITTILCEPWLQPRGLRAPLIEGRYLEGFSRLVNQLVAYCDGEHDLLAIADLLDVSIFDLAEAAQALKEQDILKPLDATPSPSHLGT